MNKFFTLIFAMFAACVASAQFGLNASYQLGLSGSDLYSSSMKNSYAGVNVKLSYNFDDYLKFNLGTGFYLIPFEKLAVEGVQTPVTDANLSVIPITIGADFTFLDQRSDAKQKYFPYIGLDLGWAQAMQSKSSLAAAATYNNFFLAPAVGVAYKFTDYINLHAEIRENLLIYNYRGMNEYYEIFSLVGLNVGASIKF